MKNVVITGATSFIGVHLINECIKNNCNIFAVVRPHSKNLARIPDHKLVNVIELDKNEIEKITDKVSNRKIDMFYHLAWEGTRVPYRDDPKIQENNYLCAIKAINAAKVLGCNTFIGTGSQAEYGLCSGKVDENYPKNPHTEYGKYKLKAYDELMKIAQKNNMKYIWIRIFSAYGVLDYENTLIMSCLKKMVNNEPIPMTECIQKWNYINVEDVAKILYLFSEKDCENGAYNIASDDYRQLSEFVKEMKKICNSKSQLQFGAIPYNSEGIRNLEPVVDKVKKNLRYNFTISFEEGIRKILKSWNVEGI